MNLVGAPLKNEMKEVIIEANAYFEDVEKLNYLKGKKGTTLN